MNDHQIEAHFKFGKNWLSFIENISDEQIREAEKSLGNFLELPSLAGYQFLDIGSGSGIHSLAARRLGANVYSFDIDSDSVQSTRELRTRYYPDDSFWIVEKGSILNRSYMNSLGQFDICYSWGVLHHTGALWQAIYNAHLTVKPKGRLFLGIYNDQGIISTGWKLIKRTYNANSTGKWLVTMIFYPLFFFSGLIIDLIHLRSPSSRFKQHKQYRGMSLLHDWKDWLGGYPYQPADPAELIGFIENLGFELVKFEPTGHGFGNNQYLFVRVER
jgi:2-polyprenyl-3-methyl-5-hydroxy-6-metoxy-1,4-benzoquinol methylase